MYVSTTCKYYHLANRDWTSTENARTEQRLKEHRSNQRCCKDKRSERFN